VDDVRARDEVHAGSDGVAVQRVDDLLPPFVDIQHTLRRDLQLPQRGFGALLFGSVAVSRKADERFNRLSKTLVGETAIEPFAHGDVGEFFRIEPAQSDEERGGGRLRFYREKSCG